MYLVGYELQTLGNKLQKPRNLLLKCLKQRDSIHVGTTLSRTIRVFWDILESQTIKLKIKLFPVSRHGSAFVIKR